MEETAGALKENIVSECDFAQLDRLLDKSPTTRTVALSGIVCFINNKTPEYLESISEEEKAQNDCTSKTRGSYKKEGTPKEKEDHI